MNITYKIDSPSMRDNWSDIYPKKVEQPFLNKITQKVIKEIINKIGVSSLSIDEISNKVLEKTKNHEIKQTTHIINNSKNIQVFSNMDVWDTYKN